MPLRLPVRRFQQISHTTLAPSSRWGTLQWVLARPLCRFQGFNLAQVPAKNRAQALALELAQWTPFAKTSYYIGWRGAQALVWAWDTDKTSQAIEAQGLNSQRVRFFPETVLQSAVPSGLVLTHCLEGYEGQLWQQGHLERSRWWPAVPQPEEWLMFQRDAGIAPTEQQNHPPAARSAELQPQAWLPERGAGNHDQAIRTERLVLASVSLVLLLPTLWYSFSWYKLQQSSSLLEAQVSQFQVQVAPLAQARSQALDYLSRITALRAINPYPHQLTLMASVSQALPKDGSYLKDWEFQSGQLKITINAKADLSTTTLISALQQVSAFREVKALPGRDPKSVTFQMDVIGNPA
jgi:Tfp pilus assembly protein PilN